MATETTWTLETVKAQKPLVQIMLLGKAHPAKLSGAGTRVATATIQGGPRAFEQYEFPWEMVVEALNTKTALVPIR